MGAGGRDEDGLRWLHLGAHARAFRSPTSGGPTTTASWCITEEQLYRIAREPHAAGWHIGTHANGDVAIDIVLRVYERLQRETPRRDPRFRIEHCTLINDDLVRRIKAQGVIPTPFSSYVYYHGEKMKEYGAERLNSMFALRSFLDAGIRATMSSDYPPGPFEPMMFLQSAVTRTDIDGQCLGTEAAHHRRGSASRRHRQRRARFVRGEAEGIDRGGQTGRPGGAGTRPAADASRPNLVTIPVERTMVGGDGSSRPAIAERVRRSPR